MDVMGKNGNETIFIFREKQFFNGAFRKLREGLIGGGEDRELVVPLEEGRQSSCVEGCLQGGEAAVSDGGGDQRFGTVSFWFLIGFSLRVFTLILAIGANPVDFEFKRSLLFVSDNDSNASDYGRIQLFVRQITSTPSSLEFRDKNFFSC